MEQAQAPQRVSALIVSYNSAGALRRCLRALDLAVGRETFEVIVVDNGSVDESPALDAEFPGATFLRLPRNFGFTRALNIAMRTAKAELFLFLSPRVELPPETVGQLAEKLEQERDAVAVCPLLETPEGKPATALYKLPMPDTTVALARAGAFAAAPLPDLDRDSVAVEFAGFEALMARAYFLKGLRHIDERYAQSWGEAEIALQIRRASKKTLLVPGSRAVIHPDELPPMPPKARALLASDWALGAATYAGKHFGFAARLKVRILTVLGALGSLLTLRDFSYNLSRLSCLVSGRKVDGTQRVL